MSAPELCPCCHFHLQRFLGIDRRRTGAGAQHSPPDPAARTSSYRSANLRADVKLVLVPVSVTDSFERPVTALRKESFRVLEDGVEQTITSFAREEAPVSLGLLFDSSGSMKSRMEGSITASERPVSNHHSGRRILPGAIRRSGPSFRRVHTGSQRDPTPARICRAEGLDGAAGRGRHGHSPDESGEEPPPRPGRPLGRERQQQQVHRERDQEHGHRR